MTESTPPIGSGASRASRDGEAVLAAALLGALDLGADLEALERLLLDYAIHPGGLGARDAVLLAWNPAAGTFRGRAAARTPSGDLGAMLDLTAVRPPDPDQQARDARWSLRRFAPDTLEPPAREAWASGGVAAAPAEGDDRLFAPGEMLHAATLRRGNEPCALLILAGAGHAPDVSAALERMAALASTALGAWMRTAAERRRARAAAALAEMTRASVSAMNVAEAFHLAARLASRTLTARGAAVWRGSGETLRLEVTHGPAGQRDRIARALSVHAESVWKSGVPRLIEPDGRHRTAPDDVHAVALVPLTAYGRIGGVIAAWDRAAAHPADPAAFDAADMEFLCTLGDVLALVLDQAGRFDALRASEHERSELRERVRHEERMAAVGELAARAAQEVRNPIASVAAFARRAHREMREDDPLREYVEIVMLEIERIGRIIGDQAALSDPGAPRLRIENLNGVVQRALQAEGEALVRRRIRLMKKLGADLPPLLLDPARMERVVGNIVARALDATPVGSRLRVETRRSGSHAVLEVSHDGRHDPGEMMEELFAPFAPGRERAGVGLGVARQIIREHGGEVRVRSDAEWSTVMTLTLPIAGNDDRRAPGDRRRLRNDRRRARETA